MNGIENNYYQLHLTTRAHDDRWYRKFLIFFIRDIIRENGPDRRHATTAVRNGRSTTSGIGQIGTRQRPWVTRA
jgi:hypothetical protein